MTLNIDDDNVLLQSLCRECYTEGVESGEVQPYEVTRTADSGRAASSSQDAPAVPEAKQEVEPVVKEEIDTDDDAPGIQPPKTAKEQYDDAAAEMTRAEAEYDAYVNRRRTTGPTVQQVRGIGARMREFSGASRKRKSSVPIKRTKSV